MKKRLIVLLILLLANSLAYAKRGDQYLLPKFGFMDIDKYDPEPLWSIGLMYGIGLTNRLSIEAEVNSGFQGGEHINTVSNQKSEYEVWTTAAYGVYRFPMWQGGYIKAKAGMLYENVVSNNLESREKKEDTDFGLAGGAGVGVSIMNRFTLEIEATVIDKDIIFYSLGTHFQF